MAHEVRARGHVAAVVAAVATLLATAVTGSVAFGPHAEATGAAMYLRVGHAPRLPDGARLVGASASDATVRGAVALKPRDPAALEAAAVAVSDPHSPDFRQFLAKGEFAERYGASPATITGVESILRSANLRVTSVSANHLLVRFAGTVGDAEAAFRTRLSDYRVARNHVARVATTAVSLPSSVASQVSAVLGLTTLPPLTTAIEHGTHPAKHKAVAPKHFAHPAGSPQACPKASKAATSFGGLTDDQIAHAYGLTGLYSAGDVGVGQRIGVFELEPFAMTDLRAFATCYFGATRAADMIARTHVVPVDGGAGTGPGTGEAILDVEDVAALAPGATYDVYEGPNTNIGVGAIDVYQRMINDDVDSVITTSWGVCEADAQLLEPGYTDVENSLFQQAALQGQTVLSAAGDAGSDDCAYFATSPVAPTLSTDDPSSQPFVTAVGGTSMSDAAVPPTERVWNDGNQGGGSGGGVSSVWSAPAWQTTFAESDSTAVARAVADGLQQCAAAAEPGGLCRQVPDVSAAADEFTGAITIYAKSFGGWTTMGGTSSAAPLWAGVMAVINAAPSCAASSRQLGGVGFLSPALYAVAANPGQVASSFHDVTQGNNDVFDISDGRDYSAGPGYDMASGLGTPMVTGPNGQAGLADYLCGLGGASARPVVMSVTPAVSPVTPTASRLVVKGSGLGDATGVSVGGYHVPRGQLTFIGDDEIDISPVPTAAQAGTGESGPQDGAGRHLVFVTGADGLSSIPSATTSVLYVDTAAGNPVPAVSGIGPYAGAQAGGNDVTVFGSGFATNGVTRVTVGGIDAPFTVGSDTQLTVTVPAYRAGMTQCAKGDDPTTDVCQAQVVVTNGDGSSATAAILPPYTGSYYTGIGGGTPIPGCAGKSCELVPATTEYDYLAAPVITGVSPTFVSEDGNRPTVATITGRGFDYLGLQWVNVGSATAAASQDVDIVDVTPTRIRFTVSPHHLTTSPVQVPMSVQTMAGLSDASSVTYAGIPDVSSVSPHAGPDTGGTPLVITGKGFAGVSAADGGSIEYVYVDFGVATTQLSGYAASSPTRIVGHTPANNPGQFIVSVCTVTGCSEPPPTQRGFERSLFDFFDPGDPVIRSLSTTSGPASGGTSVVIRGENLSDVVSVRFGGTPARAANRRQVLTNGSSTTIRAITPPGTAGRTVEVQVTTVESLYGGHPSAPTAAAEFRYTPSAPSAPRDVRVRLHGTAATLSWSAPVSSGGHRVLRYRVVGHALRNSLKSHARTPKPAVVLTRGASARHARLGGLAAGWYYRFKVEAVNRLGRGLTGTNHKVYLVHVPA